MYAATKPNISSFDDLFYIPSHIFFEINNKEIVIFGTENWLILLYGYKHQEYEDWVFT